MPKTKFVDFKAVKAAITIEQVLQQYNLLERFKRSGDTLSGPCPIHKGENPTQFRASVSKNVWNCFSECKHGGNVLDFIARMESVSIHAAALKAIEWFNLDSEAVSANSIEGEDRATEDRAEAAAPKPKPAVKPQAPRQSESSTPNPPLKFRLDRLDTKHPYFAQRGITEQTVNEFGLGYFTGEKGVMVGRIVIPIRNAKGEVVAYAGRLPGEPSNDTPKYKLPAGFRKSQELFNLERATKAPVDQPLVIVEGFFDAIKLHQNGCRKVVALMGSTMSLAQEKLIFETTTTKSMILVMLDEDEAGRAGRDDIASRLSKFCFVKVHAFAQEGVQPEHLTGEEVCEAVGSEIPHDVSTLAGN